MSRFPYPSATSLGRLLGRLSKHLPGRLREPLLADDATVVLTLDARAASTQAASVPIANVHLAWFTLAQMRRRAARDEPGFAAALPGRLAEPRADGSGLAHPVMHAIGAMHEERLIAHAWLLRGTVPPALNSGGARFRGIGLTLPPGACYLFKVHTAPDWRGRGVAGQLIARSLHALPGAPVKHIVTTTATDNTAFLRCAERLGFVTRGHARERVLAGWHLYRLPRAIAVGTDAVGTDAGHSDVNNAPARIAFFAPPRDPARP